jgi:hypothetical protein
MEQWRDIPGYEGYFQVSNMGGVRRIAHAEQYNRKANLGPATFKPNKRGYWEVMLARPKFRKLYLVHRVVMLAFVGPCPEGLQVNHINGDKRDNRLENLEYVTASENMRHAAAMGRLNHAGMRGPSRKVSDQHVLLMRALFSKGVTVKQVSKTSGLSISQVRRIKTRQSWDSI